MIRRPPRSTPFPSTTLSRSADREDEEDSRQSREPFGALEDPRPADDGCRRERDRTAEDRNPRDVCRPTALEPVAEVAGERSEEHTSELQSRQYLVCRLLLEK